MTNRNFYKFERFTIRNVFNLEKADSFNFNTWDKGPAIVDLNTIVRVDPPKTYEEYVKVHKRDGSYQTELKKYKLASVYTEWCVGKGINGITTTFYITEKDYEKVIELLGLTNLE